MDREKEYERRTILSKKFIERHGLTGTFVDSFVDFYRETIPEVFASTTIETKIGTVTFSNTAIPLAPRINNLPLYPRDVRRMRKYYGTSIYTDINLMKEGKIIETREHADVGRIPVMVGSPICSTHPSQNPDKKMLEKYDPPGYFIGEKGIERVIMTKVRIGTDKIIIYRKKEKQREFTECQLNVYVYNRQNTRIVIRNSKEVKVGKQGGIPAYITIETNSLKKSKKGTTKRAEINMFVIFEILDIEMEDAIKLILSWAPDEQHGKIRRYLIDTISHFDNIKKGEVDLATYISGVMERAKKEKDKLVESIIEQILVYPEDPETKDQRIRTLSYMIYKFILVEIGIMKPDDREDLGNKRLEISGIALGQLFRSIVQDIKNKLEEELSKTTQGVLSRVREKFNELITKGFSRSLTKKWGKVGTRDPRENMTQLLSRLAVSGTISHIRRVITDLSKESTATEAKMMGTSQKGYICSVETPDGAECGAVQQLATGVIISKYRKIDKILEWLEENDKIIPELQKPGTFRASAEEENKERKGEHKERKERKGDQDIIPLFVSGKYIGKCDRKLRLELLKRRRSGLIDQDISIFEYELYPGRYELQIIRSAGRILRPLLIIEDGELVLDKWMRTRENEESEKSEEEEKGEKKGLESVSWSDLIENGVIEYVDTAEERAHILLANDNNDLREADEAGMEYTHMEIDPALSFGVAASLIPFPTHEAGARITYQSGLEKQTISIPVADYTSSLYSSLKVNLYPQQALVYTDMFKEIGYEEIPNGVNVTCAVMQFKNYGPEDGYILNKASAERGMFAYMNYRTYTTEAYQRTTEEIAPSTNPEKQVEYITEAGTAALGTHIKGGEILINKRRIEEKKAGATAIEWKDIPLKAEKPQGVEKDKLLGIVDAVYTDSAVKPKVASVRVASFKQAHKGNKFTSRHAQKGTSTLIVPQEDMPFNPETGQTVDVIINAEAYPSRMTIGQLLESLTGKVSALRGERYNATAFRKPNMEIIQEELKNAGFNPTGEEILIDGATGEQLKCTIFVGPVYYQSVKHIAAEKKRARGATGDIQPFTRQPAQGKSRLGGIQFGEQETGCAAGHSAPYLLQDTHCKASDAITIPVCMNCKKRAIKTSAELLCDACAGDNYAVTERPYSWQLFEGMLGGFNVHISNEEMNVIEQPMDPRLARRQQSMGSQRPAAKVVRAKR